MVFLLHICGCFERLLWSRISVSCFAGVREHVNAEDAKVKSLGGPLGISAVYCDPFRSEPFRRNDALLSIDPPRSMPTILLSSTAARTLGFSKHCLETKAALLNYISILWYVTALVLLITSWV